MTFGIFLVLCVFASARMTRLVYKDTLFDEPREKLVDWLRDDVSIGATDSIGDPIPGSITMRKWKWVRWKLAYLITCPYCVGAYTTATLLLGCRIFLGPFPAPVLVWFAVWMAAIAVLEYTDGDK